MRPLMYLLIGVVLLLLLAPAARGEGPPGSTSTTQYATYPMLNKLASTFAMRPVSIHCASPNDDVRLGDAWGYTFIYPEWNYAMVQEALCNSVIALIAGFAYDDWQVALAVLVIVHESYHLRRWALRANEAAVECRAIRHWTVAMRLLGVAKETITRLKPWALAAHWRQEVVAPQYNQPACGVPWPW